MCEPTDIYTHLLLKTANSKGHTTAYYQVSIISNYGRAVTTEITFTPNPVPSGESSSKTVLPEISLGGTWIISIYDALGNIQTYQQLSGGEKTFTWDLTNLSGREVASGSYLAVLQFTSTTGEVDVYKTMIGVQR